MKRRTQPRADAERLPLLWEAAERLQSADRRERLIGGRTAGDGALLAAIQAELTPAELVLVREVIAGEATLPPLPRGQDVGVEFVERAGVRWENGGWQPKPEVASLQERRMKRDSDATP